MWRLITEDISMLLCTPMIPSFFRELIRDRLCKGRRSIKKSVLTKLSKCAWFNTATQIFISSQVRPSLLVVVEEIGIIIHLLKATFPFKNNIRRNILFQ